MKVHSFDVFDTVITRSVLYPKDVFRLVQHLIPERLPEFPPQLRASFCGHRVWSEFIARQKSTRDDIMLEDIYCELGQVYGLDETSRKGLMELELEVESHVLLPVHGIATIMDSIRNLGGEVMFISDMYLSSGYISKVLERFGLLQTGDRIYISGEKGVTKGSGKLFSHILKETGIKAHELVHYGDNFQSDYLVPKSMGIEILYETGIQLNHPFYFTLKKNLLYLRELIDARIQISGARYYV